MNLTAITSLVGAAFATAAFGQGPPEPVRLELRLVSQLGTVGTSIVSFDVASHPDMTSAFGVPRRLEVQYRLVDLNTSDDINPAGLVSGNLRLVAAGGTLERALLTKFESGSPTTGAPTLPPVTQPANLDTDTSPAAANGARGLHRPFRGGIPGPAPNNDNPANGIFESGNAILRGITPLVLSQTDQYAPADPGGGWYGLCSFNFVPTTCPGLVTASFDADADSGNRFGYFNDGDPVPITSRVATGDICMFCIPSPGAAPVLVLACLSARRRRAHERALSRVPCVERGPPRSTHEAQRPPRTPGSTAASWVGPNRPTHGARASVILFLGLSP